MNILLIVLRLLHIASALLWVGLGIVSYFYIMPAVLKASDAGMRYAKTLFTRTNFGMIFAVVSGLTTLAGILLYLTGSASHFSQTGNIVLAIGAVAGLAATIHGGAVVSRSTRAFSEALNRTVSDAGVIVSDGLSQLNTLGVTLQSHARISVVLMIIALVGMGSARYL